MILSRWRLTRILSSLETKLQAILEFETSLAGAAMTLNPNNHFARLSIRRPIPLRRRPMHPPDASNG